MKEITICVFGAYFEAELFTIRFQLLVKKRDGIGRFGSMRFLGAPSFEHFSVVLRRSYSRTSIMRFHRKLETSSALELGVKVLEAIYKDQVESSEKTMRRQLFMKDGMCVCNRWAENEFREVLEEELAWINGND